MISRTIVLQLLKECCYGNWFLARIGKKWHTPPSFCVLAFHKGWEDRTWMCALTPAITRLCLTNIW